MSPNPSALFSYLLIAIGVFMTIWGILGLIEYLFGFAPVMQLQNPTFPAGTQFLHWLVIVTSGLIFLIGYCTRWPYTPHAMLLVYAMMATLCFVQTFDFMTNDGRYLALAAEYIAYVVICLYLFRSQRMKDHFGPAG